MKKNLEWRSRTSRRSSGRSKFSNGNHEPADAMHDVQKFLNGDHEPADVVQDALPQDGPMTPSRSQEVGV